MPDILHKVAIKSPLSDTYRALTTRDGLARWWTTDTQGSCNAGGVMSMKSLVEAGKGAPYPDDVHISSKAD